MQDEQNSTPISERELVITRDIDAPREALFKAWTDPETLKKWFCPLPWTLARCEVDLRPGGASNFVMRSPEGQEFPNPGVYLEVVEPEKLVFTDAFTAGWEPKEDPFMVGIVTFEDLGNGKTRYTARVRHWTVENREKHEQMGFYAGWGTCADQLTELVTTGKVTPRA